MKRLVLSSRLSLRSFVLALVSLGCVQQNPATAARENFSSMGQLQAADDQIVLGRSLVLNHGCAGCHGGPSPASPEWLAGLMHPGQEFLEGPCALTPGATPCWHTRPRNITPDNATGLGRFTERQIFNALRYGLRPEDTPDVDITSSTPGVGNFPRHPRYLAPPMPWPAWRFMSDKELAAIAAYLKRAVKPVTNKVQESEGPPDFWASIYVVGNIGPYPAPAFPAANERVPR
jgi:mono/diheme cytochrome c family protein